MKHHDHATARRALNQPYSSLQLSPDEIKEFQQLVEQHAGLTLPEADAATLAAQLLQALAVVRDAQRQAANPADAPHDLREVTLHLRKLRHELELVPEYPSSWRWAVMALHEALTIALQLNVPAAVADEPLPALFRRVEQDHPELPQVIRSIELMHRLRTRQIVEGVHRWRIPDITLRVMCADCLRVIRRLEEGQAPEVEKVLDVLESW